MSRKMLHEGSPCDSVAHRRSVTGPKLALLSARRACSDGLRLLVKTRASTTEILRHCQDQGAAKVTVNCAAPQSTQYFAAT
mmetsp:Transcript_8928/g.27009  ORF Transcript_8928/g.27009 Transcript_8928/m.27009 type:complete len:81 (+) Transcript_8928:278-520(+)